MAAWNLKIEALKNKEIFLPRIAIETGTFRGSGTRELARHFKRVITIELDANLALLAETRFREEEISNVEVHRGNSAKLLPEILDSLAREASPPPAVFFFLDAHWSGDRTVDWSTAKWKGFGVDTAHLGILGSTPTGPEQCPLLEEFQAIAGHCGGPALILVDDLKNLPPEGPGHRNHEFPGEDWSHLTRERLRSALGPRLKSERELREPAQWLLELR